MENSIFINISQLELMAFFSGYPLLYTLVRSIAGNQASADTFRGRLPLLLPLAYAFLGLLYVGLQLRNLYPDYSFGHISRSIQHGYLKIWGISALFFWVPVLARRPIVSLVHSSVFFIPLGRDWFLQICGTATDGHILKNDMVIYTTSLLLNLGAFVLIVLFSSLSKRYVKLSNP